MHFDYQELLQNYEFGLQNKLRNFQLQGVNLDTWVPDENLLDSVVSLIDASLLQNSNTVLVIRFNVPQSFKAAEIQNLTGLPSIIKEFQDYWELHVELTRHSKLPQSPISRSIRPQIQSNWQNLNDSSTQNSASDDILNLPNYRNKLKNHRQESPYEGRINNPDAHGHSKQGELFLKLGENQHVSQATFLTKDLNFYALLSAFCQFSIGLPLYELLDHGVMRLEKKLFESHTIELKGIKLRTNLPSTFNLLHELLVQIRKQVPSSTRLNLWVKSPCLNWLRLSEKEKIRTAQQALDLFSVKAFDCESYLKVVQIKNDTRIVLKPSKTAAAGISSFLLKAEKYLHEVVEPTLELFYEGALDKNKREQKRETSLSLNG